MITQNELALKILNMGKDGYKNDAEGFEKLNQANTLIEVFVENKLRLNDEESKNNLTKPTQLNNIDLSGLREVCKSYIDFIDDDKYHEDNDFSTYIFEEALESVYGKDIWNFVNNRHE